MSELHQHPPRRIRFEKASKARHRIGGDAVRGQCLAAQKRKPEVMAEVRVRDEYSGEIAKRQRRSHPGLGKISGCTFFQEDMDLVADVRRRFEKPAAAGTRIDQSESSDPTP